MTRTILIIAFHFPPVATSSGMQRALKAVRYLREFGWRPVVLSVNPRAYSSTNPSQLSEIPVDVPVHRAFGLDATRHFAIRKRYPGFLAWPDPWASWWAAAVWTGRRLIHQHNPCAIWSTFPITTTNLVALHLAKSSGLPWIADLRDPITLDGYPPDPVRFKLARWIEQNTMKQASRIVFTAEHTRRIYVERYPSIESKSLIIPNGYDEANFPEHTGQERTSTSPFTILHSGSLQPKGRNPHAFFEAIKKLKDGQRLSASRARIVFRGCGFDEQYREITERLQVTDIVHFENHLPYEAAIKEMVEADALLLFQGSVYNHAVPAKLYEYFFARRPILGILDKDGESQRVLESVGIRNAASIDDSNEIAKRIMELVDSPTGRDSFLPNDSVVKDYSRRNQTRRLSELFETITCGEPL